MKVPIIGTALLKFGDLWDVGIVELIENSGKKAIKSAGISAEEISTLYISNALSPHISGISMLNVVASEKLGIPINVPIISGEASGALAIKEAAQAILSGRCECALVIGAEKTSDLRTEEVNSATQSFLGEEEVFIGATVQSQFAMMTKKYISTFGLKPEELSYIPSKSHKNALNNEFAQFCFGLDEKKINSSTIMSSPIRMLDCASYCDGAAALVLCSEDFAKAHQLKVIGNLIASSQATDSLSLSHRKDIISINSTTKASEEALSEARLKIKDVDLFEIYDQFPISEILGVEDMGLTVKGKGLEFIKANPKMVNLSGGIKSCGHAIGATGIRQAVDIIHRIKDNNLRYGLAHTLSGTGSMCVVNIFGK
jgi:acetyl-CoA C-acetyltransferase